MDAVSSGFDHLILDGRRSDRTALLKEFRTWNDPQQDWMIPLMATLEELTDPTAPGMNVATSGTTGPPKRIALSRQDLVSSARLTASAFGLRPGDRVLHCLPCQYVAGKMMLVRAMVLGLDLHVIDPRGSVLDNLRTNDRFRFAAMVPQQLHRALQEDRSRVERQFQTILLGGGPVSDVLIRDLQGLSTEVIQGYGSTETATHVALRRLNGTAPERHYRAIGEVSFSQDERGCLIVRTPHLSAKEHVTNDHVRLIDDRQFEWLGRADHVILSGGRKIHPELLEERTAAVIPYPHFFAAYPDDRLGQGILLVLETDRPQAEVEPEVMQRLSRILERFELPGRVTVARSLPRTDSGKIIRRVR
jgi:O-succinylbenzoic acid--CoA ligase